jgi:hypothetical protein
MPTIKVTIPNKTNFTVLSCMATTLELLDTILTENGSQSSWVCDRANYPK